MTAPVLPPPGKEPFTFVNRHAPSLRDGYRVVVWALTDEGQVGWIDGDYLEIAEARAAVREAMKILPGRMSAEVNDPWGRTVYSRQGAEIPEPQRKPVSVTALVGLSGNGEEAHRRFRAKRPKPKSLLNPAHRRRKP